MKNSILSVDKYTVSLPQGENLLYCEQVRCESGKVVLLLGENGSGKSTFLNP